MKLAQGLSFLLISEEASQEQRETRLLDQPFSNSLCMLMAMVL